MGVLPSGRHPGCAAPHHHSVEGIALEGLAVPTPDFVVLPLLQLCSHSLRTRLSLDLVDSPID
jgi:hypothetical protein